MCGICGIFNLNREPADDRRLQDMTSVLEHRGPDDYGYFRKDGLGLGWRRLSIIDLEGGPFGQLRFGHLANCGEQPARLSGAA